MNDQTKRTMFFYGLLATTLLPLFCLPALSALDFSFDSSFLLGLSIFAGGVGHVGSTFCVYADKEIRQVIRPMKVRFYVLPLVALTATGVALIWGSSFRVTQGLIAVLFIIHLLWLHFHYQKQNYGLVAFVAAGTGSRVPKNLSPILLLPALAGCLAIMSPFVGDATENESLMAPYEAGLGTAARAIYLVGAAVVVGVIYKHRAIFSIPRIGVMTAAAFLFFLPAITLKDSDFAFWSYALAHGFQYLLMVFMVAGGATFSPLIIGAFLVSVAGGGYLLHSLVGNQALFICGILLTWIHFVLDAKLWRMSEPEIRQLLRQRFGFLFS
ncbi:MAG: hypothetical protein GY768_29840 [Planctomycetaceae bacterium]|nr:hypothetical protein [Planctomycetaceae bacterium]